MLGHDWACYYGRKVESLPSKSSPQYLQFVHFILNYLYTIFLHSVFFSELLYFEEPVLNTVLCLVIEAVNVVCDVAVKCREIFSFYVIQLQNFKPGSTENFCYWSLLAVLFNAIFLSFS